MIKNILTTLCAILLVPSLAGASGYNPPKNVPLIRVAVLKDADRISVYVRGKYRLYDQETGLEIDSGRRLSETLIKPTVTGLQIGDDEVLTGRLRFELSKDIELLLGEKSARFRGWLDISKLKNNRLLVVNILDLETYVKGVLYHEISHRWPMEAMKAQAVAARTYALHQSRENYDQLFDVTSDIYSQMYGGKSAERYRTNIAVDRTEGQILIFNGDVLPAYFHANSGGHTENVRELWEHDLLPLSGHIDDYSVDMPSYIWKKNFRSKDVQNKLNQSGYNIGLIKEIEILGRNESGRITNLAIHTRDGKKHVISGKRFRHIIGPNLIRSNNYNVTMKGYYFDLVGQGWGHGVGMSQWGAHNMAKARYDHDSILKFYYPGTQVVDYREFKLPPPDKKQTATVRHVNTP